EAHVRRAHARRVAPALGALRYRRQDGDHAARVCREKTNAAVDGTGCRRRGAQRHPRVDPPGLTTFAKATVVKKTRPTTKENRLLRSSIRRSGSRSADLQVCPSPCWQALRPALRRSEKRAKT